MFLRYHVHKTGKGGQTDKLKTKCLQPQLSSAQSHKNSFQQSFNKLFLFSTKLANRCNKIETMETSASCQSPLTTLSSCSKATRCKYLLKTLQQSRLMHIVSSLCEASVPSSVFGYFSLKLQRHIIRFLHLEEQ